MRAKRSIKDSLKEYLNWCVGRLLLGGSRDDTVRDMVDAISDEIASGGGGISQDQLDQTVQDITKSYGIADQTVLTNAESYTDQKIADVVDGSPEALDTLYELAKALGDDPNFATTVMGQIGLKLPTSTFEDFIENKAWTKDNLTPSNYVTKENGSVVNKLSITNPSLPGDHFVGVDPTNGIVLQSLDHFVNLLGDKLYLDNSEEFYNTSNLTSLSQLINNISSLKAGSRVASMDIDLTTMYSYLRYDLFDSTTIGTKPSGIITGFLLTFSWDNGGWGAQIATPDGNKDGAIYMRTIKEQDSTKVWGPWVTLYNSANFNPDNYLQITGGTMEPGNFPQLIIPAPSNNSLPRPVHLELGVNTNGNIVIRRVEEYNDGINHDTEIQLSIGGLVGYKADGVGHVIYSSQNSNKTNVDWKAKNLQATKVTTDTLTVNNGSTFNGQITLGDGVGISDGENQLLGKNSSGDLELGDGTLGIDFKGDLLYRVDGDQRYLLWDEDNLPNPLYEVDTTTDLNNATTRGTYSFGVGALNVPSTINGPGWVLVMGNQEYTHYKTQICAGFNSSGVYSGLYTRHSDPEVGNWSSWEPISGGSGRQGGESQVYPFPGDPGKLSVGNTSTQIESILGPASDFLAAFNSGKIFVSKFLTIQGTTVPANMIYSGFYAVDSESSEAGQFTMAGILGGIAITLAIEIVDNNYAGISTIQHGTITINTSGNSN